MKQLLFCFLLISFATNSQDFKKVDSLVLEYPRFSKVEDLADRISKDFSSDKNKSRAAFFWLTKNIRYNLKEYYSPNQRSYRFSYSSEEDKINKLQAIKDKLIADTFKNKTGVCEEYAQSFKKICDLLHIESEVIKGYVRNNAREIGSVSETTNHAWNAVKVKGKWIILDATWAAGSEYNGKWVRSFNNYFFDIPKDKIFKTHYPEDKIWVLRFGRMTIDQFYKQPIYTNNFLALKTELISPKGGIIKLKASEDIKLKFKNLDSNLLIFYNFKDMKLAQKPKITKENNISTLIIKNPKKNTDLVLFINKKDALHFKLEI
jgi:transglutaminase/protease-like cytokinesis protein 3